MCRALVNCKVWQKTLYHPPFFHVTLKDCIELQGGSLLLKREQLPQQQLVGVTFSEKLVRSFLSQQT